MNADLPFIPDTVTVHLGAPDTNAPNVTVPFTEYITNVASSEIYPTWPEEAIRANIYAQISFVLNRIYTEFYRSRGYDFDITNST
ncbi:MAG: SpoIID/LytB domain-containing protein, partial [Clostridia bacterium]|nr:SpoIID/LytB domain-containing protein [Clostridia bacterium]